MPRHNLVRLLRLFLVCLLLAFSPLAVAGQQQRQTALRAFGDFRDLSSAVGVVKVESGSGMSDIVERSAIEQIRVAYASVPEQGKLPPIARAPRGFPGFGLLRAFRRRGSKLQVSTSAVALPTVRASGSLAVRLSHAIAERVNATSMDVGRSEAALSALSRVRDALAASQKMLGPSPANAAASSSLPLTSAGKEIVAGLPQPKPLARFLRLATNVGVPVIGRTPSEIRRDVAMSLHSNKRAGKAPHPKQYYVGLISDAYRKIPGSEKKKPVSGSAAGKAYDGSLNPYASAIAGSAAFLLRGKSPSGAKKRKAFNAALTNRRGAAVKRRPNQAEVVRRMLMGLDATVGPRTLFAKETRNRGVRNVNANVRRLW